MCWFCTKEKSWTKTRWQIVQASFIIWTFTTIMRLFILDSITAKLCAASVKYLSWAATTDNIHQCFCRNVAGTHKHRYILLILLVHLTVLVKLQCFTGLCCFCWGPGSGEDCKWLIVFLSLFFYPGRLLMYWQCVWDPCHTEKWSFCQSDTFQIVLHVDQNLTAIFYVNNSVDFDKIPNITGWNSTTNHYSFHCVLQMAIIRPFATDLDQSLSSSFPSLWMAFWEPPLHWVHFWLGFGEQ